MRDWYESPLRGRRRRVIVVLGARSGSSALAGALGLLGCSLPKNIMAANAGNTKGYFEPEDIAGLHDEILASVGSAWDDWHAFPKKWFASADARHYQARLAALFRANYGEAPNPVLKEPRMCRLLPLWDAVFRELDLTPLICCIDRAPMGVAQSLQARDGSSIRQGLLYYCRNHLDAEAATRRRRRVAVTYDMLLDDWRQTVQLIGNRLGIRLAAPQPGAVDAFLDRAMRHHAPPPMMPQDAVNVMAQQIHRSFGKVATAGWRNPIFKEFDVMRAAFDSWQASPPP